jgi:hypothetical protein
MFLPSLERYAAIIEEKNPRNFSLLNNYNFSFTEKEGRKDYCFSLGTCAAVFKARKDSEDYAIRCFLKGELETFKRYEQFNSFLASRDLSWKVNFDFLDNEIQVDGQWHPVVKMNWVYGVPLYKFIDEIVLDHNTLTELQKKLVALSSSLEDTGIGHGDLKYNNIFILKQGFDFSLKLIDYDSVFIPSFRGKKNLEPGSPGFQHPRRLSTAFSETIDRFSVWVMLTTLEVIKADSHIWREAEQDDYTNSEHSLFTVMDFINPDHSKLFQKLKTYNKESLNYYLEKLIEACGEKDLNAIKKPELYRGHVNFIPQQPVSATAPIVPVAVPEEKLHEVEIKTIPAGKDVLVNGIKKGIAPLLLPLSENDFDKVVVLNEGQRTPVLINERLSTYEIDFSPKPREVVPTLAEQDEIIEFRADKYTVQEGEPATINWKVKGNGKIHISNMGEVAEKTGTQKVTLKNTTNYVLTIGSKNSSLIINVQSIPKPVPVQPAVAVIEKTKHVLPVYTFSKKQPAQKLNNKFLQVIIILMAVITVSFFAFKYISGNKAVYTTKEEVKTAALNTPVKTASSKAPLFTQSSITSFLNSLYDAYNNRDISSIINNYASSVNEYYDSESLNKDSLSSIINNLFITPAFYSCTPDFKTLTVQLQKQNCKVVITINEKLRNEENSATENYTTTIEYLLDPSYKIVSEKSRG